MHCAPKRCTYVKRKTGKDNGPYPNQTKERVWCSKNRGLVQKNSSKRHEKRTMYTHDPIFIFNYILNYYLIDSGFYKRKRLSGNCKLFIGWNTQKCNAAAIFGDYCIFASHIVLFRINFCSKIT